MTRLPPNQDLFDDSNLSDEDAVLLAQVMDLANNLTRQCATTVGYRQWYHREVSTKARHAFESAIRPGAKSKEDQVNLEIVRHTLHLLDAVLEGTESVRADLERRSNRDNN